jgi:hypothetical protein
MVRDYSGYSIDQLQECLAIVDGNKYPENKVAIEAKLQARIDSGAFAHEQTVTRLAEKEKAIRSIDLAKGATRVIAWFLIVSPMIALSGYSIIADSYSSLTYGVAAGTISSAVSVSAGIGLLKSKTWGHWVAVTVFLLRSCELSQKDSPSVFCRHSDSSSSMRKVEISEFPPSSILGFLSL